MAALAAHEIEIYLLEGVATDSVPANLAAFTGEACGADNASFSETRESLDKTDFKNDSGARLRFQGLKDGSISLSGYWDPTDTAVAEIRSAHRGATDAIVWVNVLWAAGVADLAMCVVDSFEITGSVDGRVEFSAEMSFTGGVQTGITA